MSEADRQGTTVTADGVAVEKAYEFDRFPVPAVTLIVRSLREEPATVRISDPLPDAVAMTDVGLHSDYGEDHATVADGQVRLEFQLDPDETFTLVYGMRNVEPADLEDGPPDPGVAAAAGDATEATDSSQAVREVISEVDESETEVEPIELSDPTGAGEESSDDAPAEGTTDDETPADGPVEDDTPVEAAADDGAPPDAGPDGDRDQPDDDASAEDTPAPPSEVAADTDAESLAAALAREVRAGEADDADVAVLREALDVEAGGSTEARLRDLQSEIADLRAYTDALEAFLDDQGTARTLLRTLKDDVTGFEGDLAAAGERLDDHDDAIATLGDDVEAVRGTVDAVEETVVAMEDDLGATRKRLADLEDRVEGLAEDVESTESDLASIQEDLGAADPDRLSALEDRVESIAGDLEEVAGIQTRLQSVFADQTDDE